MCLDLNKTTEKQIASEDIICYKRVVPSFNLYKNKKFTGIICDIECEGKIQIEHGDACFCTNNDKLNGYSCRDKLGYLFSWTLDSQVQSIIVDGIDIMNSGVNFITPYQGAKVTLGEIYTYTSELIREDGGIGYDVINIGLHSFATYEDARNDGGGVIVKCVIPAGSEYYLGNFGGNPSYASNKITYIEIVTK